VTVTDLAVTGTIPPHLDGRYLRNGPNPIDPDPATYHWFTGSAMVHGLRLRDGRAEWYRNRWVRSHDVVVHVVRHPKMFDDNRLAPGDGPPTPDRWTIDAQAGKVVEERIDDHGQEWPRFDGRLIGRRHRYGYAAEHGPDGTPTGSVLKHDLARATTTARSRGPAVTSVSSCSSRTRRLPPRTPAC
jgi:carotenoid cleavage dioxygenase-like enzyme